MRYVIFKELGVYKMTSEENYNAQIRNGNQVVICKNCHSFKEAVDCFPPYPNIEFVDKTGD